MCGGFRCRCTIRGWSEWASRVNRSLFVSKRRFYILPAVEDAVNNDGLIRNAEGNGDSPSESDRPQPRTKIVPSCSSHGECLQAVTLLEDSIDISLGNLR